MKYTYASLFAFLILSLSSCYWDEYGQEEIEITYDTVPFDEIRLETSSDVRVMQSNEFKVVVQGERRDVDDTRVEVYDHRLVIEESGNIDEDQLIRIYVPEISRFENTGSSLVYGESEFVQNRSMDLVQTGSGELDFYVDVDNLDIRLTGSGYIYVEGYADNSDIVLTGSGWVRAFDLDTDVMDVRIEGSGSAEVNCDTDLDITITGSGDVYYKGHPDVSIVITGSGQVHDAN